jgi:hypothetical protein
MGAHFCEYIVPEKVGGTDEDNIETSSGSTVGFY